MALTDMGGGKFKLTEAADALSGVYYIDWIQWLSKSATAGDDLLIEDGDGNEIQSGVADGENFHQIYPVGQYYTDLTIDTIDSGAVYVKTRKHHANP